MNTAKILVVDDEQGMRDMLSYELSGQGYDVITAPDGESALKKVKEEKPGICILDMKMPGLGGNELLEKIKKIDPDIEVIMATAYSTVENTVESLRRGAFDYLRKPFDIDYMVSTIERAAERRRLKETVAVYDLSRVVFSTLDMDELLERIVGVIIKVTGADDASVMLMDPGGKLYIAASKTLNESVRDETRIAIGESISGKAAETGRGFILVNGLENDDRFKNIKGREEIKSAIVVPLKEEDRLIGVLNVNRINIEEVFSERDLRKITVFASLAALAVRNAGLHGKLKEAQDELMKHRDHLEDLVKERTVEVEAANQAKTDFLSNMSHELRTPLNSIIGFSEVLYEETYGGLNKKQKEYLDDVVSSGRHLLSLVNDILDLAKVESGRTTLSLSEFQLKQCIEESIDMIRGESVKRGISFELKIRDAADPIIADEMKIKQVMYNLLSNAVKFSPDKGKITVRVKKENKETEVSVTDTGIGILKENFEKVFKEFIQLESPLSKKYEGTGLGLPLCRKFIDLHGGRIWAQSDGEGRGSVFTFTIPENNK